MKRIDFTTEPVFYDNGKTKWYIDKYFQKYLETEQSENLPAIKGLGAFIVKGVNQEDNIEDYVLIDDKQNVLDSYQYTAAGFEQLECKINMYKINKHFDDYENSK